MHQLLLDSNIQTGDDYWARKTDRVREGWSEREGEGVREWWRDDKTIEDSIPCDSDRRCLAFGSTVDVRHC